MGDRGVVGRSAVVPEADQQVGEEADPFPAEKQLNEIIGRDQGQHEKGEQAEIGHEARNADTRLQSIIPRHEGLLFDHDAPMLEDILNAGN